MAQQLSKREINQRMIGSGNLFFFPGEKFLDFFAWHLLFLH